MMTADDREEVKRIAGESHATHGPFVLSPEYTVNDAVKRGIVSEHPDGARVMVFDSAYSFAVLEVEGGVAKRLIKGPLHAPAALEKQVKEQANK